EEYRSAPIRPWRLASVSAAGDAGAAVDGNEADLDRDLALDRRAGGEPRREASLAERVERGLLEDAARLRADDSDVVDVSGLADQEAKHDGAFAQVRVGVVGLDVVERPRT